MSLFSIIRADPRRARVLSREPWWTESIAVGRETFVRNVGEDTRNRIELSYEETGPSQWTVREKHAAYSRFSSPEIERKARFKGSNRH